MELVARTVLVVDDSAPFRAAARAPTPCCARLALRSSPAAAMRLQE
jgi:hypothetical protein